MKTTKASTHRKGIALTAIVGAIALGFALPAHADAELDTLKQELAQQRQLLEQQQKVIERLEQKLSAQEAVAAAAQANAGNHVPPGKPAGSAPVVSFYGLLDGGVEHITNIGADRDSVTRVPGITGTLPSRVGLRAEKEFKPGFKAIATAEVGFNLDNGTLGQGGRIFGRQIFAGLATPYGDFTFGRQYSMLAHALIEPDLLGPNIYGLSSIDPYYPNARFDNALAWRGKFGKVALGATYSFGRDTQGSTPASGTCGGETPGAYQRCKAWSAMAKYDGGFFGLSAAIDEQRGGPGATASFFNGTAPLAFSESGDTDRRITAGGYLKFAKGRVGLGWLGRKVETASADISSDTWYLEGAYNLTSAITLDGGVLRVTNRDQDRDASLFVLRGFYHFDKDLAAYLQLSHIANSSGAAYQLSVAGPGTAPAPGENQNGYMAGVRYRF